MNDEVSLEIDREAETVWMTSPYEPAFKDAFKDIVPYEDRHPRDERGWDPDEEHWGFHIRHHDAVETLLQEHFPDAFDWRLQRLRSARR